MNTTLFIVLVFALVLFAVLRLVKGKKNHRRDYTLELQSAEEAATFIKEGQYRKAEALVEKQELNDVTQIVDHLALSLEEKELLNWNQSQPSDLSKLSLAVYYLHIAWISRSHKLASSVSNKAAEAFFHYLQLAEETFSPVPEGSFYYPEVESRKIRLYMSVDEKDWADHHFSHVTSTHPDLLWPYIHYAELIQPKWGNSLEELLTFYEALPNNFLIKSIVELKLIWDSFVMDANYFHRFQPNLKAYALKKITEIDQAIEAKPPQSVHKFILYNYMEAIADHIGMKTIEKKYKALKNNHNTIYPHGLLH